MFKIIQHVSQWSMARPERITCARGWVYSHGGVELKLGIAVNTLFPSGVEMGASILPRALERGGKLRLRRPAEAVAVDTWDWEGGRPDLLEVPR